MILLIALPVLAVLIIISVASLIAQGRPIFYKSTRVGKNGHPFQFFKLRTMTVTHGHEARVMGGDLRNLVTPFGSWLRRSRLDELPQIWNVLVGDMSFVGPRPPLPSVVQRHPAVYRTLLQDRPGITGLATVLACGWEERLLARSPDATQSHKIYDMRSVPRKAILDQLYCKNKSLVLDIWILYLTVARFLHLPGRRARRLYLDRVRVPYVGNRQGGMRIGGPLGGIVRALANPAGPEQQTE